MPLSSEQISTIQHAGVALLRASETIAEALHEQAEHVVQQMALQPFQSDSDDVLGQFKALAGLSHELKEQEERLRSLYAHAEDLLDDARPRAHAKSRRVAGKAASRMSLKRNKKIQRAPGPLSPNDQKVLQYFQKVLQPGESRALTGAVIAAGAGLPRGSVGISVTRVVASGAVRRGADGSFQLVASGQSE